MLSENLANQLGQNGVVEDNPEAKSDDEAGEITMSVKFKCIITQIPLEGPHWNDEALLVGLDWTFTHITDFLRDETVQRIHTRRAKFDEYPKEILFRPTIQLDGKQGRYAAFDVYGDTQIERLDDWFPDGSQDTQLPMTVWICANESHCPGTAEEKWCDYFMDSTVYYHIGELDSAAVVALNCPPTKDAVLGYFNEGGGFKLSLIPMWFANGQWLGYAHCSIELVTKAMETTESREAIPATIPGKTQLNRRYNTTGGTTLAVEQFLRSDQNVEMRKELVASIPVAPFYSFKTLSCLALFSHLFRAKSDPLCHVLDVVAYMLTILQQHFSLAPSISWSNPATQSQPTEAVYCSAIYNDCQIQTLRIPSGRLYVEYRSD
jgi:hypothetical protein